MSNKFFIFLLSSLFGMCLGKAQNIFVTDVATLANINVYVVEAQVQADLIVYKTTIAIYPGVNQNKGIWYFVPVHVLADKTIYYTQTPVTADLKVFFTDVPMITGWQNPQKKKITGRLKNICILLQTV